MIGNNSVISTEPIRANLWLLNSGIQNENGNSRGGFNSWFDLIQQNYSYVYSEITGYGVTSLLYLSKYFGEEFYIDKAIAAYKWLKDKALDESGGIRTRDYFVDMDDASHYSFDSNNLYAFDNGMVLYGIVNLYKKTKNERILLFAVQIADFLIDNMKKDDGMFYAVYNSETGKKTDIADKWSTQSGSYHAKLALGFTDLYEITNNKAYKDAALGVCNASLDFQDDSGRFITNRADNSTHLHPHSYSAEGLLYTGDRFGRTDFIESAKRAVKWSLSLINQDGGIPKKFSGTEFINFYRSDILAQTLRLGSLFFSLGELGEEEIISLEKLRRCLVKFQYKSEDRQDGGFYYGYTLDGSKKDHLNSWCTMFALQGLIMYDENIIKRNTKNLECFV